jgi:Subtilase family/FG-GAP-like repeat
MAAIGATLAVTAAPAGAALSDGHPNDPLFKAGPLPNATNEQWDLASPADGFDRGISVDRAWPLSTGTGTILAEIDVGAQVDHPDLAGRFTAGWDFYSGDNNPVSDSQNSHGTNVAGVLGAAADNGIGIAGIAPGARLMALRTSDDILHQGTRVARAIVYAADHGVNVISMSLGTDSFSAQLRRAVAYAHSKGVFMAVASGNESAAHHHYPQVLDDVMAVAGINPDTADTTALNGNLASVATDFTVRAHYSDYGAHIGLAAPTQVPTTDLGGGYVLNWSGTSAATPHVAGVADLVIARGKQLGLGLSVDEVMQILRSSADDLVNPSQGYAPGWDRYSGYGRVDAYRAVSSVAPGHIPPVADISSPDWYQPTQGDVAVTGSVHGRSPASWRLELGAGDQPEQWRTLATGMDTGAAPGTLARIPAGELSAGGWTLRLIATDSNGNIGQDREFFYAQRDPALKAGFPIALGSSGEAAPALADIRGGPGKDIVLATSDGLMRVYSGANGHMLPGWPQAMAPVEGADVKAAAAAIGPVRAGFLATPAVGDLNRTGRPDIVEAGLDGRVYAWDARGHMLPGFPFRIGLHAPAEHGHLDAAIYASPALADLKGDGKLDIVFGAADQKIYAIDGRGRLLPGWPVLARDPSGGIPAKILSSPAIGDIDGDGKPEIVEGTAEAYGSTPTTTGRVYAFSVDGKLKPGWPIAPPALAANSIPLVGQGVPDSPVLADVNGDGHLEVAVAAFTGQPELYRGDGTRLVGPAGSANHFQTVGVGATSTSTAPDALALGANAAFGRFSKGGPLRFFSGLIDTRLIQAQEMPAEGAAFEHLLGGWDAASGAWLPAFPRTMEGWTILTGPVVADVEGSGRQQVLAGSSGDVLHAFREDGSEPPGWPKDTGGWLVAAPAVGDIDGKGHNDVVAVTRDGYLYAWSTPASAGTGDWPSFRHDIHNTGNFTTVIAPAPAAGARVSRLSLRLSYRAGRSRGQRCAAASVRASVTGADIAAVRRVAFTVGKRRVGSRSRRAFALRVPRSLLPRGRTVSVHARILLTGGRVLSLVQHVRVC